MSPGPSSIVNSSVASRRPIDIAPELATRVARRKWKNISASLDDRETTKRRCDLTSPKFDAAQEKSHRRPCCRWKVDYLVSFYNTLIITNLLVLGERGSLESGHHPITAGEIAPHFENPE
jgi:hypothetical protein